MRKIFVLFIVSLLILSLAGCVQPPTPGGDGTQEQPSTPPTTAELDTGTDTEPTDTEISTDTQTDTQTESNTARAETTYGPLHFPEDDQE